MLGFKETLCIKMSVAEMHMFRLIYSNRGKVRNSDILVKIGVVLKKGENVLARHSPRKPPMMI